MNKFPILNEIYARTSSRKTTEKYYDLCARVLLLCFAVNSLHRPKCVYIILRVY